MIDCTKLWTKTYLRCQHDFDETLNEIENLPFYMSLVLQSTDVDK